MISANWAIFWVVHVVLMDRSLLPYVQQHLPLRWLLPDQLTDQWSRPSGSSVGHCPTSWPTSETVPSAAAWTLPDQLTDQRSHLSGSSVNNCPTCWPTSEAISPAAAWPLPDQFTDQRGHLSGSSQSTAAPPEQITDMIPMETDNVALVEK